MSILRLETMYFQMIRKNDVPFDSQNSFRITYQATEYF